MDDERQAQSHTALPLPADAALQPENACLAALHAAALALLRRPDLDTALDTILAHLTNLLGTPHAFIYMAAPDAPEPVLRAGLGIYREAAAAPPGSELAASVWRSGRPCAVADYDAWPGRVPGAARGQVRALAAVPLAEGDASDGRAPGVLGLAYAEDVPPGFGAEELALLRRFAELATLAITAARAAAENERRVAELVALNDISQAVTAQLDLDALLELVGEKVGALFDVEVVLICVLDPVTQLVHAPCFLVRGERLYSEPVPLGVGLSSVVMRSRRALLIDERFPERAVELGAVQVAKEVPKSWLGVPLLSGDDVLGMISVQSLEREHCFGAADVNWLTTIAATVATAVRNAQLFRASHRRADEMAVLAEVGSEIMESLELPVVLQRIAERAHDLLQATSASIDLLDANGRTLRGAAAVGEFAEEIRATACELGEGIIGSLVRDGRAEIIPDVNRDPRALQIPGTPEGEPETLMCAPLIAQGRAIGALSVWRSLQRGPFGPPDIDFLVELARQAAMAIVNAQLYRAAEVARAEAEEANLMKSRFLTDMSHELRTPLNSIINFAYLLGLGSEGELTTGQSDLLTRIGDSGRHLLDVINDILDLAKIEAGRVALILEDLDLRPLADSALSTAAGLVRRRPIELVRRIPDEVPLVRADRTRVRQVLLNLLSNAAKFTAAGSIALSVQVDDAWVTVSVADTGVGISPEDLARVFVEFVQLPSAASSEDRGTGLGLSISKRFAEMLGGRLWAESEPGKGSTFHFTLPRSDTLPELQDA